MNQDNKTIEGGGGICMILKQLVRVNGTQN